MSSAWLSTARRFCTRLFNLLFIIVSCVVAIALAGFMPSQAALAATKTITLTTGALPPGDGEDLVVNTGTVVVKPGTYKYHNVNIYGGGTLQFQDAGNIDFWAESILIENNGTLVAGSASVPYGANGTLTIHLYGKDQGVKGLGGAGITCKADSKNQCGIPDTIWGSNPGMTLNPKTCNPSTLPGGVLNGGTWSNPVSDCFYQYMPIDFDKGSSGTPPQVGYFGYKVLAVSYGGTLQLFGVKGAVTDPQTPDSSGTSWARLTTTLKGKSGEKSFTIDRVVHWKKNDQVVITTTDYLPGHSEVVTLSKDATPGTNSSTISISDAQVVNPHYGDVYKFPTFPANVGPDKTFIDTRAAVGLLTRSIQIVSGGDNVSDSFPAAPTDGKPGYYFGGHALFRQGFAEVQIRGVEFYQMGQGGRIMHYPVHFHMARRTPQPTSPTDPPITFVEDSSVWDSMTRWMVLHASQGVTLARNVGYESIGHGYYLEDATEINNKLYSNLGVFARAAVLNDQNPRQVPGILASDYLKATLPQEVVPYHTDIDHPAVFWITNGWNDFEYNHAAGAGTCGVCYWIVPAATSGMSRYEKWWSYASEQRWTDDLITPTGNVLNWAGMTPLEDFKGNSCSTAMTSFETLGDTQSCDGVVRTNNPELFPRLLPVTQGVLAPPQPQPGSLISIGADAYYPKVDGGGGRFATKCPDGDDSDCSSQPRCSSGDPNCMATVLDHYTTSFNWAPFNFAAIWLRPQWYFVVNSNITDVQAGGLSFVTGGGYTEADAIQGHWGIARNTAFVGHTQPQTGNPYASDAGPFNPDTGLTCAPQVGGTAPVVSFCLSAQEGISLSLNNFNSNQRLFNIYDGPAYQENNAYLDITKTDIPYCTAGAGCSNTNLPYSVVYGMPADASGKCYLPNAAIGWKQPNGFFYPPAFHSDNLYFNNVDIRHFVIEPLFHPGTFNTDVEQAKNRYCTLTQQDGYYGMFNGFTDIDRQTELNDDDGSLTGLVDTISVNKDPFFNAPVEDLECASDTASNMPKNCDKDSPTCGTAKTSPYDFVSTVEYPDCGYNCPVWLQPPPNCKTDICPTPEPGWPPPDSAHWWAQNCGSPQCFGVPLYRQDLNPGEQAAPFIRMAGQSIAQRSSLTVNHGTYYIDTTVSEKTQRAFIATQNAGPAYVNVFIGGHTYYTFLLFAKPKSDDPSGRPATRQVYQMAVGPAADFHLDTDVTATRAHTENAPLKFDSATWPSTWTKSYKDGVLTVTMDMSFDDFKTNYDAVAEGKCQPSTFCSWNSGSNSCGCALSSTDSLYNQCQAVCSKWTDKDVQCPEGGCYGVAVKFPNTWVAKDQTVTHTGACYQKNDDWNVPFNPASKIKAGEQCVYKNGVPAGQFCTE